MVGINRKGNKKMLRCVNLIPSERDSCWVGEGCLFRIFYKKKSNKNISGNEIQKKYLAEIRRLIEENWCISENCDEYVKFVFYPDLKMIREYFEE